MDEVSIWGTALSAADVLTLYNSGIPSDLSSALSSTPDGWWRMGDGVGDANPSSGDIIVDQIGDIDGELKSSTVVVGQVV